MASPRSIRFGILGAARIAPKALIQPASEVTGVAVAAVAARDTNRARQFAKANRIPRVAPSYEALLADPGIDAIYVALPNAMHCEWSIRALRAGKHVLCEKPLACNARQAELMAEAAERSGRILGEAMHYRYHPLARRIQEILDSRALGSLGQLEAQFCASIPPPNIRYEWHLGGGALMDLGCYLLDMIRHFSGETPRVRRASARVVPVNIDVSMEAELETPSGVSAVVRCSMAADAVAGVFFAARGRVGELHVTNLVAPHRGHALTVRTERGETRETVAASTTFVYQLRAFSAAIRGEDIFATDAAAGVANMRLIDEVYAAAGLPSRGV
jgi:predicted dehydrogenase